MSSNINSMFDGTLLILTKPDLTSNDFTVLVRFIDNANAEHPLYVPISNNMLSLVLELILVR